MHNRVMDFINQNDVLYKYQLGFRKGYSTSMAVMTLVDKISVALNKRKHMLGVFLDFSKAFDTVNHKILCDKLECYGIRGLAHKWFKSYLASRTQFVIYDNVLSVSKEINCGVPRGSILGPLLFLLYVNDIANVSNVLLPILFADDTSVFLEGTNVNEMCKIMNDELKQLRLWLQINKLSLNIDKTQYMLFSKKDVCIRNVSVNISNVSIKNVSDISVFILINI